MIHNVKKIITNLCYAQNQAVNLKLCRAVNLEPSHYRFSQYTAPSNPFAVKSIKELENIINRSNKSTQSSYPLILKALTNKIKARQSHNQLRNKPLENLEATLMNKCLSGILEDCHEISLEGVLYVSEAVLLMQTQKRINLTTENLELFTENIPKRINDLLSPELVRENADILLEIMFRIIGLRKKGLEMNVLAFLTEHDLDTEHKICSLFKRLMKQKNLLSDFIQIEVLMARYIDLCLERERQESTPATIEPIILSTINYRQLSMRIIDYLHIKPYILYLHRILDKSIDSIALQTVLVTFRDILLYLSYLSVYMARSEQLQHMFKLVSLIFSSLRGKVQAWYTRESSPGLPEVIDSLIAITQISRILNQRYKCPVMQEHLDLLPNIVSEIQQLISVMLETYMMDSQNRVGDQKRTEKSKSQNFLELINLVGFTKIQIDLRVEKKFIQYSLEFLNSNNAFGEGLTIIRVLEYVAFKILDGKLGLSPSILEEPLRKMELNLKSLSHYEVIRLYAILMNLKFQSKNLQEYFDYKSIMKEEQVVENLSRTLLKPHSLPLIKRLCSEVVTKLRDGDSSSSFVAAGMIVFSLKSSKLEKDCEDNQMFKFWFYDNWDVTYEVIREPNNAIYMIRFLNKEMMSIQSIISSRPEISIQVFQVISTVIEQTNKSPQELYEEDMRPFFRSVWFRHFSLYEYRYSFLVKLLWFYAYDCKGQQQFKRMKSVKNLMLIKVLLPIMRQDKSFNAYPGHSLKKNLIWSILRENCKHFLDKEGYLLTDFWFWANYNGYKQSELLASDENSLSFMPRKNFSLGLNLELKLGTDPQYEVHKEFPRALKDKGLRGLLQRVKEQQEPTLLNHEKLLLLDLLTTPNLIKYIVTSNVSFVQVFIKFLVESEQLLGSIKLVECYKFFLDWCLQLSNPHKLLNQRFSEWFVRQIQLLFEHNKQQAMDVCLSTQRYYEFKYEKMSLSSITDSIEQYISEQLRDGNFFILKQITDNLVVVEAQDLIILMKSLIENRPLVFLALKFQNEYFQVLNQLLQIILVHELRGIQNGRASLINLFVELYSQSFLGTKLNEHAIRDQQIVNLLMSLSLCLKHRSELTQATVEALEAISDRICDSLKVSSDNLVSYIHDSQKQLIVSSGNKDMLDTFHYISTPTRQLKLLKSKHSSNEFLLLSHESRAESKCWSQFIEDTYNVSKVKAIGLEQFWAMFSS